MSNYLVTRERERQKTELIVNDEDQSVAVANTQYSREIAMRTIQNIGEAVIRVRATKSSAAFDTSAAAYRCVTTTPYCVAARPTLKAFIETWFVLLRRVTRTFD